MALIYYSMCVCACAYVCIVYVCVSVCAYMCMYVLTCLGRGKRLIGDTCPSDAYKGVAPFPSKPGDAG